MNIAETFAAKLTEAKRRTPFGYISAESRAGLIRRVASIHRVTVEAVEAALAETAVA